MRHGGDIVVFNLRGDIRVKLVNIKDKIKRPRIRKGSITLFVLPGLWTVWLFVSILIDSLSKSWSLGEFWLDSFA